MICGERSLDAIVDLTSKVMYENEVSKCKKNYKEILPRSAGFVSKSQQSLK